MRQDPKWAPCGQCACRNGDAGFLKWSIAGVLEETSSCPRRMVTARTDFLINLYTHYTANHLFVAGGVSDQPAVYLDAMAIIHSEVNSVS